MGQKICIQFGVFLFKALPLFLLFAVKAIILHNHCQFTQLRTAVIYAISEHIVHL